ncbi:type II secretion system protein [Desulfobotulus sp.]|uniref:pilus assembly FimT family protein n=1 Tax=Desulfobotulus sp. TaxID=1940337 RepID=UPI002A364497|nr:type II secretion system protein [Desulfobotulus sp.]MDY0162518.1 type II secretion system protein [Desulfobotulus sp.]
MLCAKRPGGFTLMELVVVLALMAVILGVSFPRIRLAMDADQERRQLDAFVAMLEATGQEALERKEEILLELHADHRSLRAGGEGGKEWRFAPSLGVNALRRSGRDLPETREIRFYPEGYADPVFFWMEGAMGRKTLVLHPLQVRVEILSGFVTPEGWDHGV